MTDFPQESVDDARLVAGIRLELDRSVDALDGQTLSRLNRIRHAALDGKLEGKHLRASRFLLPYGGFVTACVLAASVLMFWPGRAPETEASTPPVEDLDILTSSDSLDLYEDYEFYRWLAENDSQV